MNLKSSDRSIFLVLRKLCLGGLEKSAVNLANYLADYYSVTIILLQETDTHEYTIHPSVNIVSIYSQSECFNFSVESFFSIYRFLERFFAYTSFYSIVFISFGTKENVFFSFLLYLYSRLNRSCVRLVISERNYPLLIRFLFFGNSCVVFLTHLAIIFMYSHPLFLISTRSTYINLAHLYL